MKVGVSTVSSDLLHGKNQAVSSKLEGGDTSKNRLSDRVKFSIFIGKCTHMLIPGLN